MCEASENHASRILENARVGYTAATARSIHGAQMIWLRSSTMLAANAILTAAIGLLYKQDTAKWILILLSLVGILVCILWCALIQRTKVFSDFWTDRARELEKYLFPPVHTLKRSAHLAGYDGSSQKKCTSKWKKRINKWLWSPKRAPEITKLARLRIRAVALILSIMFGLTYSIFLFIFGITILISAIRGPNSQQITVTYPKEVYQEFKSLEEKIQKLDSQIRELRARLPDTEKTIPQEGGTTEETSPRSVPASNSATLAQPKTEE